MTAPDHRDPSRSSRRGGVRQTGEADGDPGHLGLIIAETVELPISGRTYDVVRPGDTDLLLDRVEFDPEQNLPYWAEIWPSGVALADAITSEPDVVRGERIFEIGSGLGITAIAAAEAGATLTASDYSADALLFCQENVRRNITAPLTTLRCNWRRPGDHFWDQSGAPFPVVLAADVLYEKRDLVPMLALIERLVAPDGMLWLAEPGREVATSFLQMALDAGWGGPLVRHLGPWPDPKDRGVEVSLHRLRRSG